MGRPQPGRFRPTLDSLEVREVPSGAPVHAAVTPVTIPIATYNSTFSKINNAFLAFEGPYDDTINAITSFASGLVSTILSPSTANDPNPAANSSGDDSYVQGSKGDVAALDNRLETAIGKLPNGQDVAPRIINQAFIYGGLSTDDADYFRAEISSEVRRYVSQGIKRGELVLVWPGEHRPTAGS